MRIGIIGTGQIGGTLARRLTAAGHEVSVANSRGPETLAGLAGETGARAVTVEEDRAGHHRKPLGGRPARPPGGEGVQ